MSGIHHMLLPSSGGALGAFTNVGTDRASSGDGDIIFALQLNVGTPSPDYPALPAGFVNLTTFAVYGWGQTAGGDFNYAYASVRASYAVSSSATRAASVDGNSKVFRIIGSPNGAGADALTLSGNVGSGTVSLSSYKTAACLVEIGATYESEAGSGFPGAEWTNGSVDSSTARSTFSEIDGSVVGGGGEGQSYGVYDIEISVWPNNYRPDGSVALANGSGSHGLDFQQWRIISFA